MWYIKKCCNNININLVCVFSGSLGNGSQPHSEGETYNFHFTFSLAWACIRLIIIFIEIYFINAEENKCFQCKKSLLYLVCCGCGIERFQISRYWLSSNSYLDIFFNLMHQYFSLHLDTCFDVSTSLMVPYIGWWMVNERNVR